MNLPCPKIQSRWNSLPTLKANRTYGKGILEEKTLNEQVTSAKNPEESAEPCNVGESWRRRKKADDIGSVMSSLINHQPHSKGGILLCL
jgi:hypothetical protein